MTDTPNPQNPTGTDPTTANNGNKGDQLPDLSKLSVEQLAKVLENPNFWKLDRIKQLSDRAKKVDDIEAEEAKKKEEELKKRGEFEKLLADKDAEVSQLKESIKSMRIDSAVREAAQKAGAADASVVGKLIDKSKLTIAEDGTVSGVDEAVTTLLTQSPFLKGKGGVNTPDIGNPSNPGANQQTQKAFKASELNDPKFYKEHEKEIAQALATPGMIIDDLTPQG